MTRGCERQRFWRRDVRLPGDPDGCLNQDHPRLPRSAQAWALGLTPWALHRALARGRPEIHHSDQGLQYAATDYVAALKRRKVQISMAAVGHAEENGYAERVIRTIKEEEVALNEHPDLISAKLHIGRFIDDVYCTKRIHSSLGYLTPAEFAAQWSERSS